MILRVANKAVETSFEIKQNSSKKHKKGWAIIYFNNN